MVEIYEFHWELLQAGFAIVGVLAGIVWAGLLVSAAK